MQLFSADAIKFSKKILKTFLTWKKWKNRPQKLLIIGLDPFISQFSLAHSPELIFHIMKSPDQTSVLLSVVYVNRLTIRIHWHGQLRPNGLNFFRKEHSHFYASATLRDIYVTLISNVKVENMYCKKSGHIKLRVLFQIGFQTILPGIFRPVLCFSCIFLQYTKYNWPL